MSAVLTRTATRATAALSALVVGLGLVMVATGATSASQAAEGARPTPPSQAQQALARAQALFDTTPAAAEGRAAGPAGDATLALRDLWATRGQLSGADRAAADALFARPGATRTKCTKRICVHWKPSGVPNQKYVDKVLRTVDNVHQTYVKAGYRAPRPDGKKGGNKKTDIYLADVGSQGLYGYCTSDQRRFTGGHHAIYAYCVLDNDYKPSQFPTNTPIENMQVTAAHEYYHAVQFAYDVLEDGWFMEATATWAEDELFDGVDDNVQYLSQSPLTQAYVPLDFFDNNGVHQYGDWIFFRYLTERFTGVQGGLPSLTLAFWKKADSVKGSDPYSIKAISQVLQGKGTTLREQFTLFNAANLASDDNYEEAVANSYPILEPDYEAPLGPGESDGIGGQLDHLSAGTGRFTASGTASGSQLAVTVDSANTERGSAAAVTVNFTDGTHQTTVVALDSTGAGSVTVPFGADAVDSVDVTLVNASIRYNCNQGTPFSCEGNSQDDGLSVGAGVAVLNP